EAAQHPRAERRLFRAERVARLLQEPEETFVHVPALHPVGAHPERGAGNELGTAESATDVRRLLERDARDGAFTGTPAGVARPEENLGARLLVDRRTQLERV